MAYRTDADFRWNHVVSGSSRHQNSHRQAPVFPVNGPWFEHSVGPNKHVDIEQGLLSTTLVSKGQTVDQN